MSGPFPSPGPAERFGPLYDALPLAVVLAAPDGGLAYANREFFSLTEATPEDLAYMSFADVLSMFCLGLCAESRELGCPEGRWHVMEKYIRRRDGGNAWVRVHLSRVELGGEGFRQLLLEDVTRYKETADALTDRKNLYQSIVETRPDPVCCFLPDWSLTYANASFCRCLRRRDRDLVGENLLDLLPAAAKEAFLAATQALTPERPAAEAEIDLAGPGRERPQWVRWVVQGFFYPTGHLKDVQAVGMDITDQKIAESNVLHADRLVSLGTLVSGVAHEVNNPNNFIMLNAPLALDIWTRVAPALERLAARGEAGVAGSVPLADMLEDMPRLLQGVIDGSARIADYVRELKNYARRDADSGFELLSVNDVVQSAVLLMSRTADCTTSLTERRPATPSASPRATPRACPWCGAAGTAWSRWW